jgi:tetratricopeptide (TPR) repeat protein
VMRIVAGRTNAEMRGAGLLALSLVAFLVMIAGCGGGQDAVILGTEPLDRVDKVEDELAALETWVTSKQKADVLLRFDPLDDIAIVPRTLEQSMKNAAGHLKRGNTDVIYEIAPFLKRSGMVNLGRDAGLYKRVVWVLPIWSSAGNMRPEVLKRFLIEQRGYRPSDLLNLTVQGKEIVGILGDVPVTITTLEDFELGEDEAIVDIDLAYFPSLKALDSSYMIGTASILDFLRKLKEKNVKARLVTVTLSNESRSVPVILRYLGDVIVQGVENPAMLSDTIPKWSVMAEAERLIADEEFRAADSLYGELIDEYPDDPGFYFARAMVLAMMGRGTESGRHIREAYQLDEAYLAGFFQLANLISMKGQLNVGKDIVATPPLMDVLPYEEANYNMGIMHIVGGEPEKALLFLNNVAQRTGGNADLYNLLYRTARDVGDEPEMMAALERLIDADGALVRERMPWVFRELGKLYEKEGRANDAEGMYRRYIEAAPQDSMAAEFKRKLLEMRKKD